MRKIFLLACFALFLHGADIEILSGKIDINGSIITASEDVVVLYDDMLIAAHKMRYDREKKLLDLEGDIHILKGTLYYAIGETMHMDVNAKKSTISPIFIHEKSNDLWLVTKEAKVENGVYKLTDALLSSCNPVDPEWRIGYSSGSYDSNEKWVDLYNMVIYAGEIPVAYLPYFGFTTDDTRTSGFLRPSVGWSELEGFFYEQPFYFVGSDRWDLELRYQSRSLRGEGLFSTLRFVDSPTSKGNIDFGFFKELNDNADVLGWSNKLHKGIEIDYNRTHMFDHLLGEGDKDQLYIDINYYNDIDYVNIQLEDGQTPQTSSIVTSKINYTLGGDNHYLGVYGKYFLDTANFDNVDTLQELPQIQYHKYTTNLLLNTLTYSVDYNTIFRTRPYLPNAIESLITVPVSYTLPIFNEYLNLAVKENVAISNMSFNNVSDLNASIFQDGDYVSTSQTLSVYTDLIKKYQKNIHAINIGFDYQFPGAEYKTGFYTNSNNEFDDTDCQVGEPCEFAQGSIDPVERSLDAKLIQFIHNDKGQEIIYHKMRQSLSVDNNYSLGTLENELRIKLFDNITLYNNAFYSFEQDLLEKSLSSISYNSPKVTSSVTHRFVEQPVLGNYSNYYTLQAVLGPWDHYQYIGQFTFNAVDKKSENWKIGVKMKKRCWSYELSYTENITPSSASSVTDRFIYFRIDLIPVAGINYQYNIEG